MMKCHSYYEELMDETDDMEEAYEGYDEGYGEDYREKRYFLHKRPVCQKDYQCHRHNHGARLKKPPVVLSNRNFAKKSPAARRCALLNWHLNTSRGLGD
ncbi:hypothetical protein [Candidatus Sororendozoicomonas aggregata]|uniref:hypothetical protein n=1 Tax=Candidatus Sororendozoicomonas aggregata TaxID=3073239 RepID=UPI002ED658AC